MKTKFLNYCSSLLTASVAFCGVHAPAHAQVKKPNIVVIMGYDSGIFNISAFHQGMMGYAIHSFCRHAKL